MVSPLLRWEYSDDSQYLEYNLVSILSGLMTDEFSDDAIKNQHKSWLVSSIKPSLYNVGPYSYIFIPWQGGGVVCGIVWCDGMMVWWYDGVTEFPCECLCRTQAGGLMISQLAHVSLITSLHPSYHRTHLDQKFIWLDFHLSRADLCQQDRAGDAEPI